jgi:hypothetical protein
MPRMLREIIAGIVRAESDLELAGEVPDTAHLRALTERDAPDIVIAGEHPELSMVAHRLLERFPKIRVLEVVGGGRSANVYELRPSRNFVGDISPESLLGAVRGRV